MTKKLLPTDTTDRVALDHLGREFLRRAPETVFQLIDVNPHRNNYGHCHEWVVVEFQKGEVREDEVYEVVASNRSRQNVFHTLQEAEYVGCKRNAGSSSAWPAYLNS